MDERTQAAFDRLRATMDRGFARQRRIQIGTAAAIFVAVLVSRILDG